MRRLVHKASNVFVRQSDMERGKTAGELQEELNTPEEQERFGRKLCRFAEVLDGTRPFWNRAMTELIGMCEQEGPPGVF